MERKQLATNILLLFLSLLSTISHAQNNKATPPANNVYTEDKQNITVNTQKPQFTLKLKSNPTTGYGWFLREYDANLISPVKHSFEKSDSQLMGSPGYELWTFRAKPAAFVVPQQTTIRMIYTQPWHIDSSTQTVFRVTTQKK